jgi:hypothetical protein
MINYKESEDIMKRKIIWSGEYDSMGQKIPEIKFKYKVIRWQTDGTEEIWEMPQKPTFPQMYKLINCTTIERQRGYDKDISNRTFDMWMDEESKMKGDEFIKKNERATNAWITWMARTGHKCMHDDFIAGNVVIYKKI